MNDENVKTPQKDAGILREIWAFLRVRKKYWLAPIIITMILLGIIMLTAAQSGAVGVFLYAL